MTDLHKIKPPSLMRKIVAAAKTFHRNHELCFRDKLIGQIANGQNIPFFEKKIGEARWDEVEEKDGKQTIKYDLMEGVKIFGATGLEENFNPKNNQEIDFGYLLTQVQPVISKCYGIHNCNGTDIVIFKEPVSAQLVLERKVGADPTGGTIYANVNLVGNGKVEALKNALGIEIKLLKKQKNTEADGKVNDSQYFDTGELRCLENGILTEKYEGQILADILRACTFLGKISTERFFCCGLIETDHDEIPCFKEKMMTLLGLLKIQLYNKHFIKYAPIPIIYSVKMKKNFNSVYNEKQGRNFLPYLVEIKKNVDGFSCEISGT